jgi:hypothetical protein
MKLISIYKKVLDKTFYLLPLMVAEVTKLVTVAILKNRWREKKITFSR